MICYIVDEVAGELCHAHSFLFSRRSWYLFAVSVAIALVLYGYYRLMITGLICAALGGLLAGLAIRLSPRDQPCLGPVGAMQISACGLVLSSLFLLINEPSSFSDLVQLRLSYPNAFVILGNIMSSAIALGTGGSTIALIGSPNRILHWTLPLDLLSIVGIIGALSSQRSYATVLQFISFALAWYILVYLDVYHPRSAGGAEDCTRIPAANGSTTVAGDRIGGAGGIRLA